MTEMRIEIIKREFLNYKILWCQQDFKFEKTSENISCIISKTLNKEHS